MKKEPDKEARLTAWVLGELPTAEAREVAAEVAADSRAQAFVADLEGARETLAQAFPAVPGPATLGPERRHAVLALAAEMDAAHNPWTLWLRPLLSAAAALAVAALAWYFLHGPPRRPDSIAEGLPATDTEIAPATDEIGAMNGVEGPAPPPPATDPAPGDDAAPAAGTADRRALAKATEDRAEAWEFATAPSAPEAMRSRQDAPAPEGRAAEGMTAEDQAGPAPPAPGAAEVPAARMHRRHAPAEPAVEEEHLEAESSAMGAADMTPAADRAKGDRDDRAADAGAGGGGSRQLTGRRGAVRNLTVTATAEPRQQGQLVPMRQANATHVQVTVVFLAPDELDKLLGGAQPTPENLQQLLLPPGAEWPPRAEVRYADQQLMLTVPARVEVGRVNAMVENLRRQMPAEPTTPADRDGQ